MVAAGLLWVVLAHGVVAGQAPAGASAGQTHWGGTFTTGPTTFTTSPPAAPITFTTGAAPVPAARSAAPARRAPYGPPAVYPPVVLVYAAAPAVLAPDRDGWLEQAQEELEALGAQVEEARSRVAATGSAAVEQAVAPALAQASRALLRAQVVLEGSTHVVEPSWTPLWQQLEGLLAQARSAVAVAASLAP